jgi:aryl-alcohol dehydrogenase-like predicted oxidoreductase
MKAVVDAGLTKHVGLSEFSAANVKRFHAICPVTCVQQEWSLMNRDLEPELVPACRELGIGIVAYSPLCRSLLSGDVRTPADLKEGDLRAARYPRFAPENLENNAAIAKGVKAIAVGRGVSAAQLSLAWVSNQGDDVVPIPGTTKILHLDDNLASMSVVLNKEERDLIAASVDSSNVAGGRYPGGVGAGTFADQGIN